MEYKSITYMRPSSVVKKFNDGDALVCKHCNGRINPRTMQCEYCDTVYEKDPELIGIVEYRRPREESLTAHFSIDRRALKEDGARIMEYALHDMARNMAERLMPYCDFDSRYDVEYDRVVLGARLKVIAPLEPGDIQVRRLCDEGLF